MNAQSQRFSTWGTQEHVKEYGNFYFLSKDNTKRPRLRTAALDKPMISPFFVRRDYSFDPIIFSKNVLSKKIDLLIKSNYFRDKEQ